MFFTRKNRSTEGLSLSDLGMTGGRRRRSRRASRKSHKSRKSRKSRRSRKAGRRSRRRSSRRSVKRGGRRNPLASILPAGGKIEIPGLTGGRRRRRSRK